MALNFNINLKSVAGMKSMKDSLGNPLAQRINNIFFDFNKSDLKPESTSELERLTRFLSTNPTLKIELSAHTDDVGSDAYNLELSERRARAVVDYVVAHGIAPARVRAKGYGETRPEVPNDSEENRARNRRVEFRIVE